MKRIHLFFLTIFLFCGSSFAQNPAIEWQKCLGGSRQDVAYSIQQTVDGGYIVAGYSKSNDGDVNGHHGSTDNGDYWIVKLNSSGFIQWQKSLGGSDYDRAFSIQQTTEGGYIIAGDSYSNDGDVTGNHGSNDYWIVKLNSFGSIEWQKSLGGSYPEYAKFIQQTADGGYIIAGYSYSNDGDVTGHHGSTITADYWIVKLNSTGTILWQKSLGGINWDYAYSIRQTTDGGYIVSGYSHSNDGDVSGHHGSADYPDYWIIKLNSSGGIDWQRSLGGSAPDYAYSIKQTTDGDYIVAGYSYSVDGDVTGHHGSTFAADYWIIKLNSAGIIEWQKSLGGSGHDYAYSIRQTSEGGYIIAGESESIDGDVTGHHGMQTISDYWIVKLNSLGSIEWQKSLGGTGGDYAYSIQQTTEGGYIISGYSSSNDGDVTGNHGIYDFWVVKLIQNAGFKEIINRNINLSVKPNPANSFINIKLLENSYEHLSIYNTSGQEVLMLQDIKQNNQIDISNLPCGLYYIKVQSDKGMAVGKFVKQ